MKTLCGRDLPLEKIAKHQERCSKCGGNPPHPPGSKHPVDYFSDQEARDIILEAPSLAYQLLFWLAWETGARIGELLNLKKKDILQDKCEIGLWTEKIKPRIYESVPISIHLRDELVNYSRKLRGEKLFTMAYQSVERNLKVTALEAEITRPVRTHMFRHGMVKRIMRSTDLPAAEALAIAQKIARHRRLTTTMLYGETTEIEAKDKHRKILEGLFFRG